jgi:hypothetical protein
VVYTDAVGKLEQDAKKDRRRAYVQRAVLGAVQIAGLLAFATVAPNALQLLGRRGKTGSRFNYQTQTVLSRLAKKGYVRFVERSGKRMVEITNPGRRYLYRENLLSEMQTKRPRKWDGRWRLVMFDIPERKKGDRERLRNIMSEAGFRIFQDSVWIYPYDCEDLITLLKVDMRLGNNVRYGILEKLENDVYLKRAFSLS